MGDGMCVVRQAIEECLRGSDEHIVVTHMEARGKIWNIATYF